MSGIETYRGEETMQHVVSPAVIAIGCGALETIRPRAYVVVCASGIGYDVVLAATDFWSATASMTAASPRLACIVRGIDTAFVGAAGGASTACQGGNQAP